MRTPGAESGDRAMDQPRIDLAQLLIGWQQRPRLHRRKALDEYIRVRQQPPQDLLSVFGLKVERYAPLVRVEVPEVDRPIFIRIVVVERWHRPRLRSGGRLYLDHVRPEIGQQFRRILPKLPRQ